MPQLLVEALTNGLHKYIVRKIFNSHFFIKTSKIDGVLYNAFGTRCCRAVGAPTLTI